MAGQSRSGSAVPLLLVLLGLLVGGGYWNYQKAVEAEEAVYRPFRGYTQEALEQLVEAYEADRDHSAGRYEAAASRRVDARGRAYFQEQVEEFERVQQAGRQTRDLRNRVAESQATLKLLEEELSLRAQEKDKLMLILRRAFTIR